MAKRAALRNGAYISPDNENACKQPQRSEITLGQRRAATPPAIIKGLLQNRAAGQVEQGAMPLLSAAFRMELSLKLEEAKIYAKNAYVKATTSAPKHKQNPLEPKAAEQKSLSMKEAYFKRMEKGTLRDAHANPLDRMAAMRLVDAGLWDARETEYLYKAYNKIRAKDGHRHKATNPNRFPNVADFYRFFRLEKSVFCTQILLMPKKLPIEGLSAKDVEKVCFSFAEFALAVWLLCAFDLGTLAFYMMDTEHKGYLNRGEVRIAVARIYSVHNTGPRLIDGTKPLDSKLTRVMNSLDANGNGNISRQEFLTFSHQHHHLLMPAFSIQRSVRERVFGMTFKWDKVETKRKRVVGTRSIQQVVDDVARLIPEIGGNSSEPVGSGEAYTRESDPDKVLDHAAAAYQRGDLAKAKEIYAYLDEGIGERSRDGNVRKSSAVAGFSLDAAPDAQAAHLKHKKQFGGGRGKQN